MEPDFPGVDAIAIQGEKIVAIGSDEEVMALQGPETQVVDLRGLPQRRSESWMKWEVVAHMARQVAGQPGLGLEPPRVWERGGGFAKPGGRR
jgi:hypothetical protein